MVISNFRMNVLDTQTLQKSYKNIYIVFFIYDYDLIF